MKRHSQHGIALVVTLIMLSLVTFVAVAFLGVTQRERTSNALTSSQTEATFAADAALARAQAEFLAGMMRNGNRFNYGLMVSTNYINPVGYTPQSILNPAPDPFNVNYDYLSGGGSQTFTPNDRLQNIANLLYDPRPPVFVPTNTAGPLEFRFYVDINRNGTNERTGLLPEVTTNNQFFSVNPSGGLVPAISGPIFAPPGVVSNYMVGDPEWIGILEHPELPHSAANRFVARYAYLVLPSGMSLDLNYIHNQAKRPTGIGRYWLQDGFLRDQGVGSWEINLAGFLADLNTTAWYSPPPAYTYNYDIRGPSDGYAFSHAMDLLNYRYLTNYALLDSFYGMYGTRGSNVMLSQNFDLYSDGEPNQGKLYKSALDFATNTWRRHIESEFNIMTFPWSGATNRLAFYDIQELFATNGKPQFPFRPYADPDTTLYQPGNDFHDTFRNVMTNLTQGRMNMGTYGRYTFHRLLAQMGVDSAPPTPGRKINLNFNNIPPNRDTDFIAWTPLTFFTNAIQRMIPYYLNTNTYLYTNYVTGTTTNLMSITNIPIYPVSYYTVELHRILQLAANIYDAMSPHQLVVDNNGTPVISPMAPSVFRPILSKQVVGTQAYVWISDWVQVASVPAYGAQTPGLSQSITNSFFGTNVWASLSEIATNTAIPSGRLQNVAINGTIDGVSYGGNYDVCMKGLPAVVGAKKGLPNFNEIGMQTTVLASRRLELIKPNPTNKVVSATNQMLTLTITNTVGFEIFYPYSAPYPRNLEMQCMIESTVVITNNTGTNSSLVQLPLYTTNLPVFMTNRMFASNTFNAKGKFFAAAVSQLLLPQSILYTNPLANPNLGLARVTNNTSVNRFHDPGLQYTGPGLPVPNIGISITNTVRYIMVDRDLGRVVDFVTMTNLVGGMDLMTALRPTKSGLVGSNPNVIGIQDLWDPTPTPDGSNRGITNQIWASFSGPTPKLSAIWTSYQDPYSKTNEVNSFRNFMGMPPINATGATNAFGNKNPGQTPYNPSVKLIQNVSWEANDPFVHYMAADLLDPVYNSNTTNAVISPPNLGLALTARPLSLGVTNWHYNPWGGGRSPNGSNGTNDFNVAVKDPGVRGADDWDFYTDDFPSTATDTYFPINRIANVGWLGRVHRGTPWQTVYMKSPVASPREWYFYSGSYVTHPTNDWRLFELFTAGINDNATRGALSVNQTNRAAWSAILSGVPVLTNNYLAGPFSRPVSFGNMFIEPNSTQLVAIVNGINRTRTNFFGGVFTNMGQILATPELSTNSPFINRTGYQIQNAMNDVAMERIPQQIMSLLTLEEHPRVTIYAFGQSLKPAAVRPFVLTPGAYFMLCTNYQVTGETITRTVLHVENLPSMVGGEALAPPRIVIESFNIVPGYDY